MRPVSKLDIISSFVKCNTKSTPLTTSPLDTISAAMTADSAAATAASNAHVVLAVLKCGKRWTWKQHFLVLYLNSLRRNRGKRLSQRAARLVVTFFAYFSALLFLI